MSTKPEREPQEENMNTRQIKSINELNRCFKECFSTKAGKVVHAYLEAEYHTHETTYRGDSTSTVYGEGQRTVVLDINDRRTRKPMEVGE